jgi:protein-tyrosine-phosphatase
LLPLREFLKRLIPAAAQPIVSDCREMPPDKAITYLRVRAWRKLGLRSDKAVLRRLRPQSVLFVCHGNIMRSPMAAELFRTRIGTLGSDISVASAGTWTSKGRPADPRAIAAAQALGVSLAGHRSQPLTPALIVGSELVCVMDYRNEIDVLTRFPGSAKKTIMLGGLDASSASGPMIPDPYSLGPDGVEECYRRLDSAVSALVRALGLG